MKKTLIFVTILFTSFLFSQKHKFDIVFKNANIVSMENDKTLLNQNVAIKDGKIIVIENAKKSKLKGEKTIDLQGKHIMPSLADAHVHFPETEEELLRMFNLNMINGVTKLRSMRGDWKHKEWKEKYNEKNSVYPKLYLSAPPISRNIEATASELDTFVKKAKEGGFSFVKILSIKNQEIFVKLDSLCKKYDILWVGISQD